MAAIPVDAARVRPVRFTHEDIDPKPASAAIMPGTVVTEVASGADAGKWVAGNGGANGRVWILLNRAIAKNYEVTAQRSGLVDIGEGMDAKNIGDVVYATPAGGLDDAATGNRRIGTVTAGFGNKSPRRLLKLDA